MVKFQNIMGKVAWKFSFAFYTSNDDSDFYKNAPLAQKCYFNQKITNKLSWKLFKVKFLP